MIHPNLVQLAWEAWEKRDAFGIIMKVGHQDRGKLLIANISQFLKAGIYEAALFEAYIHGPYLHQSRWKQLFAFADREKLSILGEPIPTEEILVFRGVKSDCRHSVSGVSWTKNPNTAAWFALRNARPGDKPAVYSLRVKPKEIFFITNERAEEEVMVSAWNIRRMKRLDPMPDPVKPAQPPLVP
jgi:hypothetical protein